MAKAWFVLFSSALGRTAGSTVLAYKNGACSGVVVNVGAAAA
jgi:hypothetical protein